MSETKVQNPNDKVTATPSTKVKDPKRVAAGKALAAKNKERLAKMKEYEKAQQTPSNDKPLEKLSDDAGEKTSSKSEWKDSQWMLIGASIAGALALGYMWKPPQTPHQTLTPAAVATKSPTTPQQLDEFDI
jgi:hypothetical protein